MNTSSGSVVSADSSARGDHSRNGNGKGNCETEPALRDAASVPMLQRCFTRNLSWSKVRCRNHTLCWHLLRRSHSHTHSLHCFTTIYSFFSPYADPCTSAPPASRRLSFCASFTGTASSPRCCWGSSVRSGPFRASWASPPSRCWAHLRCTCTTRPCSASTRTSTSPSISSRKGLPLRSRSLSYVPPVKSQCC